MHDMILGQPRFAAETLHRLAKEDVEGFLGTPRRLAVTGCGTSFHAAMFGARILDASLGNQGAVRAVHAYDLLHGPRLHAEETILGVSHSGSTETTNRALARARRHGARVLGIVGLGGSPMEKHAARCLTLGTVHDGSWANTMSYTTQLSAFAYLAAAVGRRSPVPDGDVRHVPSRLEASLGCEAAIRRLARSVAFRRHVTFLGSGLDDITALEGALKIRETCSLPASGYHTEQFLHGPFLALDREDAIVALRSRDNGSRANWILDGLRSAGALLATVGDGPHPDVRLPAMPAMLRPIVSVVPLQFLAYYAALERRVDPDVMRTDVPRYRRGIELLFSWRPRRASSVRPSRPRRRSAAARSKSSRRSRT
jgi:glucosamine--fructose-6-phosphate aminotransferase (isomerizing)